MMADRPIDPRFGESFPATAPPRPVEADGRLTYLRTQRLRL